MNHVPGLGDLRWTEAGSLVCPHTLQSTFRVGSFGATEQTTQEILDPFSVSIIVIALSGSMWGQGRFMGNINHSSLLDQFLNLWKAQDLVSGWVIEAGSGRGQGSAWAVFVVRQYSAVLEVIGIAGLPFHHWGSEQGQADRWRNKPELPV